MRKKPSLAAILFLIALMVLPDFRPLLSAQSALPTPQELDQLLAPVALYPDALLSQITTASTNPQEILDVDNWLQQNGGLTGTALTDAAEKAGFDPAFIALTSFPQVLDMMAQHVDDYAAIGQAFSTDQGAVTASIQRLRSQAYAAGSLRTNSEQKVDVQQPAAGQTVYVIQQANPQVVYVPVYDPTVVYVGPSSGAVIASSLITFGAAITISALLVDNRPWGWSGWGWNWGMRRAYYNHIYWSGWSNPYRPPHFWYRPRPVIYSNRPGYGGNWRYRPQNYRPPSWGNRPGYNRPPYGPGNRPGYNRPGGNRPGGNRPVPPPRPGTPNRPGTPRPGIPGQTRPAPNRPGTPRPGTPGQTRPVPNRPSVQPVRPTNPSRPNPGRPGGNRPSPQPRPGPQPKPAPRPSPDKREAQPQRTPR